MSSITRLGILAVALTSLFQVSTGAAQKSGPYFLTQADIAKHPDIHTAFEAVQQLRPRFLRGKASPANDGGGGGPAQPAGSHDDPSGGSSQSDGILVVLDGVRVGGVAELKAIPADQVESIRFIKADEARDQYGNQTGVIEVKTSLRSKPPGA